MQRRSFLGALTGASLGSLAEAPLIQFARAETKAEDAFPLYMRNIADFGAGLVNKDSHHMPEVKEIQK
jgi:hypothetical protein